jgi:hypothetical protein
MADGTDKPWTQRPAGRVVAAVLMAVCAVLLAKTVGGVYAEGHTLCDGLYAGADRLPGPRPPCSARSTPVDGAQTLIEYAYGADGDLERATFWSAEPSGGREQVSCSMWGKLLIPLVHHRRWLAAGAAGEWSRRADTYRSDEVDTIKASTLDFETRLVHQINPQTERLERSSYSRHDRQGRLVQSTTYDSVTGTLKVVSYDYDGGGDLVLQELSHVTNAGVVTSRTDYTYDCWE